MLPTCPFPSLWTKARHHAAREVRRRVSLGGIHPFVYTMCGLKDVANCASKKQPTTCIGNEGARLTLSLLNLVGGGPRR